MKMILSLVLTLLITTALFAYQPTFSLCQEHPVYTVKDLGESAYFINERLKKQGIHARIIFLNAKNCEILYDEETYCNFFNTGSTACAYHAFVAPFRNHQIPSNSVPFIILADVRGNHAYVTSFKSSGEYLNLKPILFPCNEYILK